MTAKNGWSLVKLNELGFVGRGKSRHRPRNDAALYGGTYPFVQTANIMASDLYITSYSQTYNDIGLAQSKLWNEGTLCMTIAGENTGEVAILKFKACFPDSIVGFVADPQRADVRFVKYCFDTMKQRLKSISRGATQDNLSLDKLLSFDLSVPPLPIQRQISDILSAYDDLIENNARRIKVLEEMSQMIYREWFVNFRFPGHSETRLVTSKLGSIPEGWNTRRLGELITLDKGVSYSGAGLTEDGIPMVNLKNIFPGGGFRRDATKPYSGDFKPRHTVKPGDVIVANTDLTQAGNVVASPALIPTLDSGTPILMSHHLYAVRCLLDISPLFFYHLMLHEEFRGFAKGFAVGTTVLGLPREAILDFTFACPPETMIRSFVAQVSPMDELIETLHQQNDNLRQTRDLLLPKLLSGEVNVENFGAEAVAQGV